MLDAYGELTPLEALLLDARIAAQVAEMEEERMDDLTKGAGAIGGIGDLGSYIRRQRSRWAS